MQTLEYSTVVDSRSKLVCAVQTHHPATMCGVVLKGHHHFHLTSRSVTCEACTTAIDKFNAEQDAQRQAALQSQREEVLMMKFHELLDHYMATRSDYPKHMIADEIDRRIDAVGEL